MRNCFYKNWLTQRGPNSNYFHFTLQHIMNYKTDTCFSFSTFGGSPKPQSLNIYEQFSIKYMQQIARNDDKVSHGGNIVISANMKHST